MNAHAEMGRVLREARAQFKQPLYDSKSDISDNWRDETGQDDLCEALFDHADGYAQDATHADLHVEVPTLIGVVLNETERRDREWAVAVLGYETVCRIEEIHLEDINERAV